MSSDSQEIIKEPTKAVIPAQAERSERANYIIGRYALFGTAAGLLPHAAVNVAALTAVQTKMIQEIAKIYHVEYTESTVRLAVQNVITSLASRIVVGGVSRLIKSFGPLKYLLGGMSSAALSGALTAEVGQIYKQHFQGGGTLADITLEQIFQHIKGQVESGEFNLGGFAGVRGRLKYLRSQD